MDKSEKDQKVERLIDIVVKIEDEESIEYLIEQADSLLLRELGEDEDE